MALALIAPALLASSTRLEPWKIRYLDGLGAEAKYQYGQALRYFDEARKLQSKPIKNEWFAQYGRHDYDPPYHIALCLLKLGGDPKVIEAWIDASRRGGVTPPEILDALTAQVHLRQGTPVPPERLTPRPTVTPTPSPAPPSTPAPSGA